MSDEELQKLLEADLAAIESDIASGNYEAARVRMQGIPANVSPGEYGSRQVGNFYWKLGFPAMAGRYWYFEDHKTAEMIACCGEFEQSCGNHPQVILESLSVDFGNVAQTDERYKKLEENSSLLYDKYGHRRQEPHGYGLQEGATLLGCAVLFLLALFLLLTGAVTIIKEFLKT